MDSVYDAETIVLDHHFVEDRMHDLHSMDEDVSLNCKFYIKLNFHSTGHRVKGNMYVFCFLFFYVRFFFVFSFQMN